MKWISKALGGNVKEGQGSPDTATDWLKRLEDVLIPIRQRSGGSIRQNLTDDILSFVATGEPCSVLAEITLLSKVGDSLQMTGYSYQSNAGTRALYDGTVTLPLPLALRWTRVLEASVGAEAQMFYIQMPDGSHWPEALLMHASGTSITCLARREPIAAGITASLIEALLVESGLEPHALLTACFATPFDEFSSGAFRMRLVTELPDYSAAVARHADALRPLLLPDAQPQCLHVIRMLMEVDKDTLSLFTPELTQLVISDGEDICAALGSLVRSPEIIAALKELAVSGTIDQRIHTLRRLRQIAEHDDNGVLQRFVRDTAQADEAPWVQALLEEWGEADRDPSQQIRTASDISTTAIEPAAPDEPAAADAIAVAHLRPFWDAINEAVERRNRPLRQQLEQEIEQGKESKIRLDPAYPDTLLVQLQEYIQSGAPLQDSDGPCALYKHCKYVAPLIPALAATPKMDPETLFRILNFFGLLIYDGRIDRVAIDAFNTIHRTARHPSLVELSQSLETIGIPATMLLAAYCDRWQPLAEDWSRESIWPYFAQQMDAVVQMLQQGRSASADLDRARLFGAVAALPSCPPDVVDILFDLAFGGDPYDRLHAQDALTGLPGKEGRIVKALAGGKADIRGYAAQWLARLQYLPAVPMLEQALLKEKHNGAKAVLLDALHALGQPIEKYFHRDKLADDADRLLKKGIPKELSWFPWKTLPAVRWADNQQPVPENILRWVLLVAYKQKSPEPNITLRQYCTMFEPADRENFGQFVLNAWLDEDMRPLSVEEAGKLAASQARAAFSNARRHPEKYPEHAGKSMEDLTALFLPEMLQQSRDSAIHSKGILAVAAACAGEHAAEPVAHYLKEYHATRAVQSKALFAMLAWIEHPSSARLLLSASNRFRNKNLQKEAMRQAEALAERKGWTASELADRTIPTAGFEENDILELSYGKRTFNARLSAELDVELFDSDGGKITVLPKAKPEDVADLVKAAKKMLFEAKKSIGEIVESETIRLHEALCTERQWIFSDWNQYLNRHAIMRRLVQRLVWMQVENGKVVRTFRPLEDGHLTDADGHSIQVPPDACIQLAHDSILFANEVKSWLRHLENAQVAPLFQQLGKGGYSLSENKRKDHRIVDFEGYMVPAHALREHAARLGYVRSRAEETGWFYAFEKHFQALGMTAVIEFTGCDLHEETRSVALLNLSFVASIGNAALCQHSQLPLARVPKVWLSECYNDLRLIAAEGTGYDQHWKRKTVIDGWRGRNCAAHGDQCRRNLFRRSHGPAGKPQRCAVQPRICRRCRNINCSSRCMSCSLLISAPASGGMTLA
ncbi:MAG: DUF4132 domain-containing protein [Xanthomonadaceae bacterium]|nr:DUF4132 domain-containing protein [Xanthomonadaceae bacterium]